MRYRIAALTGARIRAARLAQGRTQRELAHEVAVTPAVVTRWETGSHAPHLENLVRVGIALGVEPGSLVPSRQEVEQYGEQ